MLCSILHVYIYDFHVNNLLKNKSPTLIKTRLLVWLPDKENKKGCVNYSFYYFNCAMITDENKVTGNMYKNV